MIDVYLILYLFDIPMKKNYKNFLKIVRNGFVGHIGLVCAFIFGFHNGLDAQASAYSFVQSTGGAFTPLTSGTVLAAASANSGTASLYNVSYPLTIPFSFNYNGKLYTDLKVSSNGYIAFGGTDDTVASTPISGTYNWEGSVSAWGRAINTFYSINNTTGDIQWEVLGTAPNRELVIQWTNFRPTYTTSTTAVYAFSFQIRLKETSNQIEMVYTPGAYLLGTTTFASTAQVGLRGANNSDFNNRTNASTIVFTNSSGGTANNSTQYFSTSSSATSGMPPAGLSYLWSPPACFAPTLTTGSSTTNSITVNWAAPTPAPGSYDVYYSTTNSAPTSSTTPTQTNINATTTTIGNSLSPLTVYYVWVRGNCGSGNYSAWSLQPLVVTTLCQPPALLSTTGTVVCSGGTATVSATADTGAIVKWYDVAAGGTALGTGTTFTAPMLTSTTNYYAAAVNESEEYIGKQTLESGASTGGGLSSYLIFTAFSTFTLQTVDLFPYSSTDGTAGTVTIELRDSSGAVLQSKIVNVVGRSSVANSTPQTVSVDFVIPPGVNYRLGVGAWTGVTNMYRDSSNLGFPYTSPGIVSILGGSLSTPYYYFFYNWKILKSCESVRTQVTATVDSACLATQETDLQAELKVYPNPFNDYIYINDVEKVKSLRVSDVSGKILKTIVNPTSEIRLNDLTSGMYLILLDMKDGSKQTLKAIKK